MSSDEERLVELERRYTKLESIAKRNASDLGTIAGGIIFVILIMMMKTDFRSSVAEGLVVTTRDIEPEHALIAIVPAWMMADDRTRSAIGKLFDRVLRK